MVQTNSQNATPSNLQTDLTGGPANNTNKLAVDQSSPASTLLQQQQAGAQQKINAQIATVPITPVPAPPPVPQNSWAALHAKRLAARNAENAPIIAQEVKKKAETEAAKAEVIKNAAVNATEIDPNASDAFVASIMSMIDGAVQPNALNQYYQSTYHFRLFMMSDTDVLTLTGENGKVVPNVGALYRGIDQYPQITIAESGVTGFNIRDVVINTQPAGNAITRASPAQMITITITEPGGISFLDSLVEAGKELKLASFPTAHYYLDLKFLGYDESGEFAGGKAEGTNSVGRWIWQLTPTDIKTKINEAGAVYTCNFQAANDVFITDKYDVLRVPQVIYASGDDLQSLFESYRTALNAAWKKKYNGELVVFDGIKFIKSNQVYPNPISDLAARDPGTFKMKPPDVHREPQRSWKLDEANGVYTVTIVPGYAIPEFIMDAFKHTLEGQSLTNDDGGSVTGVDQSAAQVNSKNFKESITWSLETVIKQKEFDRTSGNYIKHITFYVTPQYFQPAISRLDVDKAAEIDTQRNRIKNIIDNGLFHKRYDYIFTGLNTEVLDLELAFDLNFKTILDNYGGTVMRYDALSVNARTGDASPNQGTPTEIVEPVDPIPLIAPQMINLGAPPVLASAAPASTARVAAGIAAPQVTRFFIEDLLSQQTATNPQEYAIPISFWQGNKDIKSEAGDTNFVGQVHRGKSVAAQIWAQTNGQGTHAYQELKPLKIRGDPFWLGQSNLHRQILLENGDLYVPKTVGPQDVQGQHVYVHFQYPLQTGDDFKPSLKDSQTFNGLYKVTRVIHNFSEGTFKQDLFCTRQTLFYPKLWTYDHQSRNGGASSSAQLATTTNPPSNVTVIKTFVGPAPPSVNLNLPRAGADGPVANVNYIPGNKDSFTAAFTPLALQASKATGIAPEVILALAGSQTNWGQNVPAGNNLFGVRDKAGTYEITANRDVNGTFSTDTERFPAYPTSAAGFTAFSNFVNNDPQFSTIGKANGITQQAQILSDVQGGTTTNVVEHGGFTSSNVSDGIGYNVSQQLSTRLGGTQESPNLASSANSISLAKPPQ